MIQQRVREETQDWETVTEKSKLGEKLLGKTSGRMNQGKETWWWNENKEPGQENH